MDRNGRCLHSTRRFNQQEHGTMKSGLVSIRSKQLVIAFLAIACVAFACPTRALGQRRTNWQYQPAKRTLSPYMNLLQTNVGPVPNYYSLVRPRLQQDAFNRQVEATERAQSLRIQAIATEERSLQPISRTGKAAGFMDYLHYYPSPTNRSTQNVGPLRRAQRARFNPGDDALLRQFIETVSGQ
jgi:hypothetical protein